MSKTLAVGKKKKSGIVERLQKSLHFGKKLSSSNIDESEDTNDGSRVPDDVKEGHFAAIAVDDEEVRRFIVPLSYLTHPSFLRLLEQAAEEYGFDHHGALTLPCSPSVLERILAEQLVEERKSRVVGDYFAQKWGVGNKRMVESC